MKKVLLSCENLTKKYSDQVIFNNLNIKFYENDFTVIMGPSGAGKSTLMYFLSGIDKADSGSVYYNGVDINKISNKELVKVRRKNFGFVFQNHHLLNKMSLLDNVLAAGFLERKNRKETIVLAKELFEKVNLRENIYKKTVSEVSGGEAQRAAIVRSLINKPDVLFADEPTGALNSKNSKDVLDIFSEFNKLGQTIIMVTHDKDSALRGNRVIYLKDGVVAGECDLGLYIEGDVNRKEKLNKFLEDMGW